MDAELVYVVADDQRYGKRWAAEHKPRMFPRVFSSASTAGTQGLYLKDVPVYVVSEIPPHVREAWQKTGANLVYL